MPRDLPQRLGDTRADGDCDGCRDGDGDGEREAVGDANAVEGGVVDGDDVADAKGIWDGERHEDVVDERHDDAIRDAIARAFTVAD